MTSTKARSPLREFAIKLTSFSILLLPAAFCATLNILAIIKGPTTWLVWPLALGSSSVCLWILKWLLPDRYPFFADTLKPNSSERIVTTRMDDQ